MPTNPPNAALVCLNRFGMGARQGDLRRVGADPRGALKAELGRPDIALIAPEAAASLGLMSTAPNIQAAFEAQEDRRRQRLILESQNHLAGTARAALPGIGSEMLAGVSPTPPAPAPAMTTPGPAMPKPGPSAEQKIFRAEAQARFDKAALADLGFVERLVAFWSNHFCVSVAKGDVIRASAGSFEREAIRPYVLGSFLDMLLAVERHPAMLFFLDNTQSIGPDSPAGQRQKRGLNENLAREIMELHTLGVGSGYGQGDVTALARVLTGWTFAGREGRLGEPGSFVFNLRAHEPGDAMVVGKAYMEGGLGQGEAVLTGLARNPATATHIATKLARHFIADDPPPGAVERLARVFRERDGDLRALAATLVDSPECWSTPLDKLRNPYDLGIASARLLVSTPTDPGPMLGLMRTLGMPLWEPPGPNGFPDTEAAWGSPEGMKLRLDLAARLAHVAKPPDEPLAMLDQIGGPAASDETRDAISRAESKEQALALLLMSPEFQRR